MIAAPPTIQKAIRALAGQCDGTRARDGVGFNGADARFGRSLAALPSDDWSPRMLEIAHRMLRTYAQQLAGLGISYNQIRLPEAEIAIQREAWKRRQAPRAEATARKVTYDAEKKRWLAEFPYDQDLVREMKEAGLRCFCENRRFLWPIREDQVAKTLPVLERAGFDGLEPIQASLLAEVRNRTDSRATTSDIEVILPGGALKPFQAAGVAFAMRVKRVLIGDQPGLGKSVEAIATVEALGAYPCLVVPPASLKINWKMEYRKFLLDTRRVEALEGLDAVPSPGVEVYIANYDILRVKQDERLCRRCKGDWKNMDCPVCEEGVEKIKNRYHLVSLAERLSKVGLQSIIMDEFHMAKNPQAGRTRAVKALAERLPVRIGLTGTPFKSRPIEGASQFEILGHLDAFGGYMAFAKKYAAAVKGKYGWDKKGASNLAELNERMRSIFYVRRTKDEVLKELPPKQRQVVVLPLSNRREYDDAEHDFLEWIEREKGLEAAERAGKAEWLAKIAVLRTIVSRGKMPAAKEWVSNFLESGEKLAIFAHHIEAQDALAAEFKAPQIKGGASATKTEEEKKRFFGEEPLIVCSLLAGGLGHTLHCDGRCSSVAIYEEPWTPGDVEQVEDRTHRIGQVNRVNVYHLVAEATIDEDMIETILAKQAVVDAATDGKQRASLMGESVANDLIARLTARARKK